MDVEKIRNVQIILGVSLLALFSPLFLIFIEQILPYPYIVEELAKFVLAYFIVKLPNSISRLKLTLMTGFLFSLSESFLYLGMAFSGGFAFLFFKKLVLVTPLHLLTLFLFLFLFSKFKKMTIFPLFIAFGIHFFFNQLF